MTQTHDALIFDMDGTLWDAVDSYVWIWNEGFSQLGIDKTFTREELVGMMGEQPDIIIGRCIADQPDVDIQKVYDAVFGLQERTMPLLGGKLYEGVREGLEQLSGQYKLFVLSNCEHYAIRQFLEFTNLSSFFVDSISFGETRIPKALNMQLLKARHQLNNPVYIGDTDSDRKQSEAAGIPFIHVTYGFGQTEKFAAQFNDFTELTKHFLKTK